MSSIVLTTNPPDLVQRLADQPRYLRRIAGVIDKENQLTVGHIISTRMTGQGPFPPSEGRLGVRTGRLRRSLRATRTEVVGDGVVSAIGTNVQYMGPHEFGGQTAPHVIRAKNGKALRFGVGGRVVFRKSVKHPGSKIPARAPIRRGIEFRQPHYTQAIGQATVEHIEGRTP
jgi:phage gpG-like protein